MFIYGYMDLFCILFFYVIYISFLLKYAFYILLTLEIHLDVFYIVFLWFSHSAIYKYFLDKFYGIQMWKMLTKQYFLFCVFYSIALRTIENKKETKYRVFEIWKF